MNKKYITSGLFGLFAIAMVSAMVVNYISNTSEIHVSVEKPFTTGFYDSVSDSVVDELAISSVYAGETISFENRIENLANVDTNVYLQYVISNDLNDVSEADFSNVNIDVRSDGMGSYHFFNGTFEDLCNFATAHGSNECEVVGGALILKIPNFFWHNEKAEVFADLTFDSGVVPSDYSIESTVLIRN